jgi:urease accessory protein
MPILTVRQPANPNLVVQDTLVLTAAERQRSRYSFIGLTGQTWNLQLPRGTVLQDGDLLTGNSTEQVRVLAKSEPVLTATAANPHDLLRAAYHLGNRHVPLEVQPIYLRLSPDPVLAHLLEHLGLTVQQEMQPFRPEVGAYTEQSPNHHAHSH